MIERHPTRYQIPACLAGPQRHFSLTRQCFQRLDLDERHFAVRTVGLGERPLLLEIAVASNAPPRDRLDFGDAAQLLRLPLGEVDAFQSTLEHERLAFVGSPRGAGRGLSLENHYMIPRYRPDCPLPPYAFVPGRSPHPVSDPKGHSFGVMPATPKSFTAAEWATSRDYLFGIDLFNHGYYWEAHEAWEVLWHSCGRSGPTADFLKGLIHLAAAGVK